MKASERAKERGCVLPLTLIGQIHGVTRQTMNNVFNSDAERFDMMVDEARKAWESLCKK